MKFIKFENRSLFAGILCYAPIENTLFPIKKGLLGANTEIFCTMEARLTNTVATLSSWAEIRLAVTRYDQKSAVHNKGNENKTGFYWKIPTKP